LDVLILITALNDPRIEKTIESLLDQNTELDYSILIADGGSSSELIEKYKHVSSKAKREVGIEVFFKCFPGSIAETRDAALNFIFSEMEEKPKAICFIDTDEIAPSNWLKEITSPIVNSDYHFVFGPTKPVLDSANFVTRYIYFDEERMYRLVKDGFIYYGAMGNSAWSSELFISLKKKYGYYINAKLTMGGEDYELTLRALSQGFRGTFNEKAWVWHDQRNIDTLKKLIRKKWKYLIGAAKAYSVQSEVPKFTKSSILKYFKYGFHPIDVIVILLSFLALVYLKICP